MIQVHDVTKVYQSKSIFFTSDRFLLRKFRKKKSYDEVISHISFQIKSGDFFVCVGFQESGKSTLIRLLSGMIRPTTGTIRVNGIDPFDEHGLNGGNIGVVFGGITQLWHDTTVDEAFGLMQLIYSIPNDVFKARKEQLVQLFNLNYIIHELGSSLDSESLVCCNIALSLIHNPKILLLDDITAVLDVDASSRILSLVHRAYEIYNLTVVLTSTSFGIVKEYATSVMWLFKGANIDSSSILDDAPIVLDIEYGGTLSPKDSFEIQSEKSNNATLNTHDIDSALSDLTNDHALILFSVRIHGEPKS